MLVAGIHVPPDLGTDRSESVPSVTCITNIDVGIEFLTVNGKNKWNTQISIAPIRIFLHKSGENISGYLISSDPLCIIWVIWYDSYHMNHTLRNGIISGSESTWKIFFAIDVGNGSIEKHCELFVANSWTTKRHTMNISKLRNHQSCQWCFD